MLKNLPVLPTEQVPEATLKKFAGALVSVTGVWHSGEQWVPTEEASFFIQCVTMDLESVYGAGMEIEIGPLKRAIQRLQEGWVRYSLDPTDSLIRDGLVKQFEYNYELSHKTLKRYLQAISPESETIAQLPFQNLIRMGCDVGLLLNDWSQWKRYREMRNKSSHAYDLNAAQDIVEGLPSFLEEIVFLRDRLSERLQ